MTTKPYALIPCSNPDTYKFREANGGLPQHLAAYKIVGPDGTVVGEIWEIADSTGMNLRDLGWTGQRYGINWTCQGLSRDVVADDVWYANVPDRE